MSAKGNDLRLPENGYRFLGTIRPRSAAEIHASNWTLGCETLDRDYADYEEYKEYLVPLGIKTIRLQGGWAKTEKKAGEYQFQWLDTIVDDARARGLNILLETGYGNPIYPGGGGWDLAGGFPSSEAGVAAWDRWVTAMAEHYRGRVRDWAMWNEPDINPEHTPQEIARFNIRTAEIIRRIIPDARIAGLSLARSTPDFFESCLKTFQELNRFDLFNWFIYHDYQYNPDRSYPNVEALKELLARYAPAIKLRQGENGCPSEMATKFALSGHPWTEISQAKWDLRRMLGDLGHDIESAIFTICDFNHIGREINHKGLLRAGADHKVTGVKQAYRAIQHLTAIFDDRLERLPSGNAGIIHSGDTTLNTYRDRKIGEPLFVFWDHSGIPDDSLSPETGALAVYGAIPAAPVWVELVTGKIFEIPPETILRMGDFTIFRDLPIYDSPCLLAGRDTLSS